jgi:alkylation response protein AidB-like acyl-CoA dehydrogenase
MTSFAVPEEVSSLKDDLDEFIEAEIRPLEEKHPEYFDYRREDARTNWEDGTPTKGWEDLLDEMRARSDEAGFRRLILPEKFGGKEIGTLTEVMLKEHLAKKGPGLHCVIHTGIGSETPINEWRDFLAIQRHGSEAQKEKYLDGILNGNISMAFGMTEPDHGSDPTYMDTTATKEGDEWVLNGQKRFIGGMHNADIIQLFARTSGEEGSPKGISSFIVPTDAEGLEVEYFHWTMNLPATQAELSVNDVRVPESAVLGDLGEGLIQQGRDFLTEGWLMQATLALGTAQYCIDEIVDYSHDRVTFDEQLSKRQGIQFPVTDLYGETEMVRNLLYKIAWMLDEGKDMDEIIKLTSIANYRATELAADAADQAMQVYGGKGWTRHYPFEYLYRQFRRYQITEGAVEIQKRRAAGYLFGFIGS